jgi:hypothetical protein
VLDGIEVDCSFIRGETSVQCPANDCGPRLNRDSKYPDGTPRPPVWEFFYAFVNGYAGYMSQHGRYSYTGGNEFFIEPLDEKPTGVLEQNLQKPRVPQSRPAVSQGHTACHVMADLASFVAMDAVRLTNNAKSALEMFDREFSLLYHGPRMNSLANMNRARELAAAGNSNSIPDRYVGPTGFKPEYEDSVNPDEDQTHHFSAHVSMGINGRSVMNFARNALDNQGDANLGEAGYEIGADLTTAAEKNQVSDLFSVGYRIRKLCNERGRGLTYEEWRPIRTDVLRR